MPKINLEYIYKRRYPMWSGKNARTLLGITDVVIVAMHLGETL